MDTTPQTGRPASRRLNALRPGVLGPLGGALGMLVIVVVSRFVTADLTTFSSVTQRSCGSGFCVERVHRPDLLFLPGYREIHVGHDGPGPQGRYYVEQDPFDDYSQVTVIWNTDGGVNVTDRVATLNWSGGTLSRLDD